ncbi:MAG: hypothetical protein KatS3mg022_3465 [Armatimonadota bacterium]|nr:MAG: hypothetical protein KatS3mg022_3465 [Armatimonadota bacterium]
MQSVLVSPKRAGRIAQCYPHFRLKQEWFTSEHLPDPCTAWQQMQG